MFGWIPILGPIIDGITSVFSKYFDSKTQIETTAMETSTQLAIAEKDDIGVRLARDLIMFPVALWTALITWDNIVTYEHHNLFYKVADYPPTLQFLPYAVMTFLFGYTAMSLWKR